MDVFSLCRWFGSAQNKRPFTERDLGVVRLLDDSGLVCSNGIGLSKCKICLEGRSGSLGKSTLRAAKLQVLPFWDSRCDLAVFLLPLLTLRINRRLTFFLLKSLTAGTFVIYTSRNVYKLLNSKSSKWVMFFNVFILLQLVGKRNAHFVVIHRFHIQRYLALLVVYFFCFESLPTFSYLKTRIYFLKYLNSLFWKFVRKNGLYFDSFTSKAESGVVFYRFHGCLQVLFENWRVVV